MSYSLMTFSEAIADLVSVAAPSLVAIRIGPNRHISGIVWRNDLIVTSDQALPAQDTYTLVTSSGALIPARSAQRDATVNIATLRPEPPFHAVPVVAAAASCSPGTIALALGADPDGGPTVRLGVVNRLLRASGGDAPAIMLDIPGPQADHGGPVIAANGALLGMLSVGPNGEAVAIPHATIARFADPLPGSALVSASQQRAEPRIASKASRGWLGVALQPITVPEPLAAVAAQSSGRMVVSVTPDGPADRAGLMVGDVLLALNGYNTNASHAMRAFLGPDRIGQQIDVRLMRGSEVMTVQLTVAAPPPR